LDEPHGLSTRRTGDHPNSVGGCRYIALRSVRRDGADVRLVRRRQQLPLVAPLGRFLPDVAGLGPKRPAPTLRAVGVCQHSRWGGSHERRTAKHIPAAVYGYATLERPNPWGDHCLRHVLRDDHDPRPDLITVGAMECRVGKYDLANASAGGLNLATLNNSAVDVLARNPVRQHLVSHVDVGEIHGPREHAVSTDQLD